MSTGNPAPDQNISTETIESPVAEKSSARLEYKRRVAEMEEQIRVLDEEIEELKIQKKGGKRISRRNFLQRTATLVLGTVLASKPTGVSDNPPKTEGKPSITSPEKKSLTENKKTVENEIAKCRQIIANKQYEEIIKSPSLVSALYYSKAAVKKMAPPNQNSNEKIIWNIYPLITKEFRRNYINTLKKITARKNAAIANINSSTESLPLTMISLGENLKENHNDAIDLFVKEGSAIYSMSEGIVVLAENNWKENDDMSTSSHRGGNTVIIFNPFDESFYRYAHMRETKISPGTVLVASQQIGIVGHTGINASKKNHGGHLHFEINRYDKESGEMMATDVFALKRKLEMLTRNNV